MCIFSRSLTLMFCSLKKRKNSMRKSLQEVNALIFLPFGNRPTLSEELHLLTSDLEMLSLKK